MPLLYTLTTWNINAETSEELPGLLVEQIVICVKNLPPNSFFMCYFPRLLSYYCWCEYVPIIALFYDLCSFYLEHIYDTTEICELWSMERALFLGTLYLVGCSCAVLHCGCTIIKYIVSCRSVFPHQIHSAIWKNHIVFEKNIWPFTTVSNWANAE